MFSLYDVFMKYKFNFRVYKKHKENGLLTLYTTEWRGKDVLKDVCSFGFITCSSN